MFLVAPGMLSVAPEMIFSGPRDISESVGCRGISESTGAGFQALQEHCCRSQKYFYWFHECLQWHQKHFCGSRNVFSAPKNVFSTAGVCLPVCSTVCSRYASGLMGGKLKGLAIFETKASKSGTCFRQFCPKAPH